MWERATGEVGVAVGDGSKRPARPMAMVEADVAEGCRRGWCGLVAKRGTHNRGLRERPKRPRVSGEADAANGSGLAFGVDDGRYGSLWWLGAPVADADDGGG
ncbi:Os01g0317350 [Oryza sativa Japonica Group]|uniref:Os01g0317350 protein n=1 Tax=Oryza sativa subsp. japonica TaxID=39947 RepID=A0A0P0V299_ORYSJ|nr:Os01g0317350 [Oryza sativa Japonica Group]